jgi:hypothetical protein
MNKRLLQTLGAITLMFAAGVAQAVIIPPPTLAELFAGQNITAGDKTFSDFQLLSYTTTDPARDLTLVAPLIDVIAINDPSLDPGPGLQFIVNQGALDVTGNDPFFTNIIDYMFAFKVTAAPGYLIKDNSLEIDPTSSITRTGVNGIGIQELIGPDLATVSNPLDPNNVENKVEYSWNGALTNNLSGSVNFSPSNSIWVSKDIAVWADINQTASLTGFTQRFSQQTVPEPSTVLLMAIGIAGLGFGRRKLRA